MTSTARNTRNTVTTERAAIPATASEREMLRGYLDFHRATLA
jgi:hypothetical protein